MSLQSIQIQDHYRSDRHNLIQDFYVPCLSQANIYSRAVGYFSSTSIVLISQGLAALIEAGGKMRLVASPHLSPEDIRAIKKGLKQREEVVSKAIIKEFEIVSRDRLNPVQFENWSFGAKRNRVNEKCDKYNKC